MNISFKLICFYFLLIFFFASVSYSSNIDDKKQDDYCYVNECFNVNLRSLPNTSTESQKIRKIDRGTKIKIIEEVGSWYHVETTDDFQSGYMKKNLLVKKLRNELVNENNNLKKLLHDCEKEMKSNLMKFEEMKELNLDNKSEMKKLKDIHLSEMKKLENKLLLSENRLNSATSRCLVISVFSFFLGCIIAFLCYKYYINRLKNNGMII